MQEFVEQIESGRLREGRRLIKRREFARMVLVVGQHAQRGRVRHGYAGHQPLGVVQSFRRIPAVIGGQPLRRVAAGCELAAGVHPVKVGVRSGGEYSRVRGGIGNDEHAGSGARNLSGERGCQQRFLIGRRRLLGGIVEPGIRHYAVLARPCPGSECGYGGCGKGAGGVAAIGEIGPLFQNSPQPVGTEHWSRRIQIIRPKLLYYY